MANWRWVYSYLVKVGELVVLPMLMSVGVGWVVSRLKTLTFLVLLLAVIKESLRGCFTHDEGPSPSWGHLLVLVCVGVDLFGLKPFAFVVLAIVLLKGFLGRLFEGPISHSILSDRMNRRRRWDGFLSLRGQQLLLLMCGGVGLVGPRTFSFITLGVVAIEGFLAILGVQLRRLPSHVRDFLVVVLPGLAVFTLTSTPPTIEHEVVVNGIEVVNGIAVGALILAFLGRRRAIANDLAHALEMLQEVEAKLLSVDPYPYSERCKGWHPSVNDVCNKAEKFLSDNHNDEPHSIRCSLGLCSTCEEAQKLLIDANGLAREGKRSVTELRQLQRQDRMLIYEHKYKALHGMAMASHWTKVLDFVELEGASASSSWLCLLRVWIWGRVGRSKTTATAAMMGIWGMRGVGKTTLLRCVRDYYAHDAASPLDHVFLLGAGGGAGCIRHALSVSIGGHLHPRPHPPPDVAASAISSYLKGKSFLLLLDDVRERLDLAAVGLPVPLGHTQNQKVVFTTRYRGVCAEMGCGTIIGMECLEEHEAWRLFKDKAGDEAINANPRIKHLANKMVAECRGLPSALCSLGRAMSTKRDVKEWRYAYDVLLECKPPPHHQGVEIRQGVDDEIQEMDDEGYSHLHQLEDALREGLFRFPNYFQKVLIL